MWYILWLKSWVRRKTSWLQLAVMLLLALAVTGIHWPKTDNTSVGLYPSRDALAQKVTDLLAERESVFDFIVYDDEETMHQHIISGRIDCGFAFDKDFEKNINADKQDEQILFMCTPSFAKGMVARETVYSAFLEVYSRDMLSKYQKEIFGNNHDDEEVRKLLLEKYDYYLDNTELFQVITEEVDTVQKENSSDASAVKNSGKNGGLFPLQGDSWAGFVCDGLDDLWEKV